MARRALARHFAADQEHHRLAQRQLLLGDLVGKAVELVADAGQLPPLATTRTRSPIK